MGAAVTDSLSLASESVAVRELLLSAAELAGGELELGCCEGSNAYSTPLGGAGRKKSRAPM